MIVFYRDRFHRGPLPIPPQSPWLRHGVGIFETLLWRRGHLAWVDRHLARAAAGLEALGLGALPAELDVLLAEVVRHNQLQEGIARVSLHLGPEREGGPVVPMVMAEPYLPPPADPVEITISDGIHVCSLARFKTSAYLPYREATRQAREMGAWDAAFLDGDGHLTETGCGALLFADDEGLVAPETRWKLPSIALAVVARDRPVREAPVTLDDLDRFRYAWVLNSLVGALPVDRIGAKDYVPDPESAVEMRGLIWQTDGSTRGDDA
jgi:branched-subunit amino acid aminotransferase/4-amino-4-deoxychorismate lyase